MKITEKLIQFVWQHQLLNTSNLKTLSHQRVVILHQGVLNTKAGPDFKDAKVLIDDIIHFGSVEIHINESDWFNHKHHEDLLYNTVILHICLHHGKRAIQNDGTRIPTVILANVINPKTLAKYQDMMLNQKLIPCSDSIHNHYEDTKSEWFTTLMEEKLMLRFNWFANHLKTSAYNWSQTFYIAFMRVLGASTNADAFEELACRLPLRLLIKHKHNLNQLEALLLGVAACIPLDNHSKRIKVEYNYLKLLYRLNPVSTKIKSSAVRPNAQPVKRLKLLARVLHNNSQLINQMISMSSVQELRSIMQFQENGKKCKISSELASLILINAIIPFRFFQNKFNNSSVYSCFDLMRSFRAERNHIIEKWKKINIVPSNSFESQAILHLYKTYCIFKRCLDCQFGIKCLKRFD